jgi:hypothetical protein
MKNKIEGTSKKPTWKLDLGLALVIGAAVFQAYQFGRALYVYDPAGWNLKGVNIGGLFLGAIVNVIVVLAATRLPALMAAALKAGKKDKKTLAKNERKMQKAGMQAKFAQGAFFGLLILSPLLVAPAMYILWIGLPLAPILVGFLAIGWASAPDIAIALGGFVAGQPLVGIGSEAAVKGARTVSDSAPQSVGRAKKSDAPATDSATSATESDGLRPKYPRTCEHCASDSPFAVLKSANAVGGHMKKHHPELCKTKATLADNLFAKVDQPEGVSK